MAPKSSKSPAHPLVDTAARRAFHTFQASLDTAEPLTNRAERLSTIADALESNRDRVIQTAARESHLLESELAPEFDRTLNTLRLFASLCSSTNPFFTPTDCPPTQPPDQSIGPNHHLISHLVPIGPVAVFTASNFPLAYGSLGGDTASALAAGCPVIIKEHPAHPHTGRLLFTLASAALKNLNPRQHWLHYLRTPTDPHDHRLAHALVTQEHIAAVGFTGSFPAGTALDTLARTRPHPIPVYAEMGSINPVLITELALRQRAEPIAQTLAQSILARAGQQCTKPGLIILLTTNRSLAQSFEDVMSNAFARAEPRPLVAPWIAQAFRSRTKKLTTLRGVRTLTPRTNTRENSPAVSPTLHALHNAPLHPELTEETFGPHSTIFTQPPRKPLPALNALTWSIFAEPDEPALPALIQHAAAHAGRIIFNGPSTGLRICAATVHTGPFPSSNHPASTAAGPHALRRWSRPVCFQNFPPMLAPSSG
ncbi:MAG: aldehyde dehydrogenase family protein [Phycisphaerales bacterium]|nr:aldehyde dehydrogenase family protein [Phycisphaerales bacterium]